MGRGKDSQVAVATLNLSGRVFMPGAIDDPFQMALAQVESLRKEAAVIVVDMHAEATSEKTALGYLLDGKVSAVVGTHTHVPTCDHRLLPKGTAYCSDLGMTGPYDSVIGVEAETIVQRFLTGMPGRFETAKGDPRFAAVVVEVDAKTGRAKRIQRMLLGENDLEADRHGRSRSRRAATRSDLDRSGRCCLAKPPDYVVLGGHLAPDLAWSRRCAWARRNERLRDRSRHTRN